MTKSKPTASLVSTGEEVLRGEIFDANNHYLANTLGEYGFEVQLMMTAGDRKEDLQFVMDTALQRADYLFMSGGLGPTEDDLTTTVAADLAGRELVFDEASWEAIVALFRKYKLEPGENNKKQAMLPQGADILANGNGTAPGFSLTFDRHGEQKTIVALPGPPRELHPMINDWLSDRSYTAISDEEHLFLRFLGIGESPLAEALEPWTKQWGEVSFRQAFPEMEVKLYQPAIDKRLSLCEFAKENLSQYLTTCSRLSIPDLFNEFMQTSGKTLAMAESCTGGLAAKIVSDTPHCSDYFLGGIVSYANAIKTSLLEVSADELASDGPVTAATAEQMATSVREQFNSDLALSFTGIAGPGGGTKEKPVGTVWLAKADAIGCQSKKLNLLQDRDRIRTAAAHMGLRWLMEDWLKGRYGRQITAWSTR
jgi:nicotinamide-nucleotide amidase